MVIASWAFLPQDHVTAHHGSPIVNSVATFWVHCSPSSLELRNFQILLTWHLCARVNQPPTPCLAISCHHYFLLQPHCVEDLNGPGNFPLKEQAPLLWGNFSLNEQAPRYLWVVLIFPGFQPGNGRVETPSSPGWTFPLRGRPWTAVPASEAGIPETPPWEVTAPSSLEGPSYSQTSGSSQVVWKFPTWVKIITSWENPSTGHLVLAVPTKKQNNNNKWQRHWSLKSN